MIYDERKIEDAKPVAIIVIYANGFAESMCEKVEDVDDVISEALEETVKDFHYELNSAKGKYTE